MKTDLKIINIAVTFLFILGGLRETIQAHAQDDGPGAVPTKTPSTNSEYFSIRTMTTEDGKSLEEMIISGPPNPPPGYELERVSVALPQPDQAMAINTLTVPAYDWVFGCSAVSGAMIAAYYDRNGFSDIYTGPTNGGVMPLDSSGWITWTDGVDATYPNNPLVASHNGVDGRTIRGSIDDYWVSYDSSADDPYITNSWTMHTWGDAIGDYMKTSQSVYGNRDGSTAFYNWTTSPTPLTCSYMETSGWIDDEDGTYGRKLFYEARGYTVTDCYNQKTDNNSGGFTYAMFMAEIDAGRPVLLNLAGHSIVGVGYDDSTNTVYIHDTWDYGTHTMTWGESYAGMDLLSVSIVNLAALPSDDNYEENDTLATAYDLSTMETVWLSTIDGYGIQSDSDWYQIDVTPGDLEVIVDAQFAHSEGDINIALYDSAGIMISSSESTTDDEYIDIVVPVGGTYYIEVYYGDQGNQYDLRWDDNAPSTSPGSFDKAAPTNGATGVSMDPTLSWGSSNGTESYEYCYDTTNDNACSNWTGNGTNTSVALSGLSPNTTHYWHVRAVNSIGTTYSNDSATAFWSFTTLNNPPNIPSNPSPADGAVDQDLNVNLSWTGGDPDGDTVSYDVYFDAGDSTPDILVSNDQSGTSYNPGSLSSATDYCWQIEATDEHGGTISGPVWCFTTLNNPPNTPSNPSPDDGAVDQDLNVNLSWTGIDPDGDTVSYDVYFEAGDSTPDNLLCNDVPTTTCDPGALMANTHYYWYVLATDEHGASSSGPVWDFTTLPPEEQNIFLPIVSRNY